MGDVQTGRRWVKWAVTTAALLIVIAGGIWALSPGGPREYTPAEYRSNVISTCQDAARKSLRDPESARFDSWAVSELPAGSQGERQFSASGFVNAKNGFGGYTGNQTYQCSATVTLEGKVEAQAGPK